MRPFFQHPLRESLSWLFPKALDLGVQVGYLSAQREHEHHPAVYYNMCDTCGETLVPLTFAGIPLKGCPNRFDDQHYCAAMELIEASLPPVPLLPAKRLLSARDVARAARTERQRGETPLPRTNVLMPVTQSYISVRELLEG